MKAIKVILLLVGIGFVLGATVAIITTQPKVLSNRDLALLNGGVVSGDFCCPGASWCSCWEQHCDVGIDCDWCMLDDVYVLCQSFDWQTYIEACFWTTEGNYQCEYFGELEPTDCDVNIWYDGDLCTGPPDLENTTLYSQECQSLGPFE